MKATVSKTIERRRLKKDYVPPVPDFSKKQKGSLTVPNQSLSISEIVKRFTRGIAVDVIQRDPVYVDQSEHDLERISRMDFADKAAMADAMRDRTEQIGRELQENERRRAEAKKRKAEDEGSKGSKDPGIDPLDNTMPVDTNKKK